MDNKEYLRQPALYMHIDELSFVVCNIGRSFNPHQKKVFKKNTHSRPDTEL